MTNELTYWFTLAMMPVMWTRRKNEIFVKCFVHEPRITIEELFENEAVWDALELTADEQALLRDAKSQLPNNSFLVESLLNEGYSIIPLPSAQYPPTLKANLKQGAPTVLFAKGNLDLLGGDTVAVVGSRKAGDLSLEFTRNVARNMAAAGKVVVSGFAKGVDRAALEAALDAGGHSIIVLPQGITTFGAGYKEYYKEILQGKVLVVSTFHPRAPWMVEFAMARNAVIYGMAQSIYVAQSDDKGGTWSGVVDGLRRDREIYVRFPEPGEENANKQLIAKGAKAVDIHGALITDDRLADVAHYDPDKCLETISQTLAAGPRTSKDLLQVIGLNWTDARMKKFLRQQPDIEEFKSKGKIYFRLKSASPLSLF